MKKLTKKQRAFLAELVSKGTSQTQAYIEAYGGDRETARRKASALLKQPHIKQARNQMRKMRDAMALSVVDGLEFDQAGLMEVMADPGGISAQLIGAYLLQDCLNNLSPNATTEETMLQGTGKGKQKIVTIGRKLTQAERASNRRDAMKLAGLGQTNVNVKGSGAPLIIQTDAVDEDGEPIG